MALLLDFDVYDFSCFTDDLATVRDVTYAEVNGAIVDEFMVRENVEPIINTRDTWYNDTRILAKFQNTLEAGNVYNNGIKIVSFNIKRKLATDLNSLDVGTLTSSTNNSYDFYDYTQPNGNLVYTIIPIGENGLDGTPIDANVTSSFSGIWLVDKDTNNTLPFDKAFSLGNADSTLNQTRTILETFSKYAQVYYSENSYETLTLTTIVLPDDGTQSNAKYLDILNKFITNHTPKLLKFDTGKSLVVDVGNVRTSTPMATWNGYDYFQLTVDVTEIQDVISYLGGK